MKKNVYLISFAAFVYFFLNTKILTAEDQRLVEKSKEGVVLGFSATSGLGVFQDIQVPLTPNKEIRGDGTQATVENQNHFGIPLAGSMAFGYFFSDFTSCLKLELLRLSAISGPPETIGSTYSRIDLVAGSAYEKRIKVLWPYFSFNLTNRRSMFNNVSTGHYVSAILPRAEAGVEKYGSYKLGIKGGMSLHTEFGYETNEFAFQGKKIQKSTASLKEIGISSGYGIYPETWLDIALEQEMIDILVTDVNEYTKFGLAVAPTDEKKTYHLSTRVLKIGFTKYF